MKINLKLKKNGSDMQSAINWLQIKTRIQMSKRGYAEYI